MVNKKSVGAVTEITQENRLIASVTGLFTKAIILAMRIGTSVARGTLLGKQTSSGLYVKFMEQSDQASNSASGQKDIVVDDSSQFRAGDLITIKDDSSSETKTIDTIASATDTITVTVNLSNSYTTAANSLVYLTDGSQTSADVVILQDNIQDIASDVEVSVIVDGVVKEDQVQGNLSDLTKADVQRITFI